VERRAIILPERIYLSNSGSQVVYYLDADATGNIYADAYTQGVGFQVFEIVNPASTCYAVTTIIPATADQLGGVYVSKHGSLLNIVDSTARTVSQYALPWIKNELPFNVLGPTLRRTHKGQPVSGGFDRSDANLALGDAESWIDVGNVGTNRWSVVRSRHIETGVFGAAYVPSDK
jgi:hypothetical protein